MDETTAGSLKRSVNSIRLLVMLTDRKEGRHKSPISEIKVITTDHMCIKTLTKNIVNNSMSANFIT